MLWSKRQRCLVAGFLGLGAIVFSGCAEPKCGAAAPPSAATPAVVEASKPEAKGRYGEVASDAVVTELGAFTSMGDANKIRFQKRAVQGQPFHESLYVEVSEASPNPWDLQLQTKTERAVEKGDVLLATFYLRTEWSREESGEGQTEFIFELGRDPWTKSASFVVRAGREWKKVHVPFVAAESYAAGDAHVNFRVGFAPQKIEIGGVVVESFGKRLSLADLPVMKITYPGMEPDAAWRGAAAERIEKIRKAELRVLVKNKAGKPVPDALVSLSLTRPAFGLGTCVPAALITEPGNETFKQVTRELFTVATLENDLKWQPLAGDWGGGFTLDRAKAGVNWLRRAGLDVRGHVLVWPGWRNLPKSLRVHEKDPAKLRAEVKRHVVEMVTAMKGSLVHWDVVNEPFDNHDLLDILGPEVMVEWFKEARAHDPSAKLFINDYAILSGGGGTTPHRDAYEKYIQLLVDKGAPFDGIGMQGHFGSSLTGPEDLLKILDRFAKFGKRIWVTEYDVVINDEAVAADYTRDFYTTLFSHPAVGGIIMWGFWDGSHWKHNAPLYRQDFSLKPAGQIVRDFALKTWRTQANGKSDAQGNFATRGFLGEYQVEVSAGAEKKAVKATLSEKGTLVTVTLD
ncbi:MAG: endo-1,4-beta-xylanase [Myxococcota bacterium]